MKLREDKSNQNPCLAQEDSPSVSSLYRNFSRFWCQLVQIHTKFQKSSNQKKCQNCYINIIGKIKTITETDITGRKLKRFQCEKVSSDLNTFDNIE